MNRHLTRRSLLSAAGGALAGAGVVAGLSGETSAAVRLEQLTATGGEHAVRSVESVTLAGDVGYRWDIPDGQPAPELFEVTLYVGENDTEIASTGGRASSRSSSGTLSVSADVLQADGYNAETFAPTESGQTVPLPVMVRLEVVGSNETLATATQRDTADVTVTQAGYDAALHGSVGGDVSVLINGE